MPSWVRYSISVYLGLLLAGSLVPMPNASVGSQNEHPRLIETVENIDPIERAPRSPSDDADDTGDKPKATDD